MIDLPALCRRLLPLLLMTLAGCTIAPPEPAPRLLPSGAAQPGFAIPSPRERMIYLARQEWMLFGRPEVDYQSTPPRLVYPPAAAATHETQPPFFSRVMLYWYAVSPLPLLGYDGEIRPWSAAFIVWLVRSAGVPQRDLPSSVLHWDYIAHALQAKENARFIARDARRYAPQPGDLLCAPRGDGFVDEVNSFERLRRGAYHCDLVVERRPGALAVIGGNVLDVVALSHVALDDAGYALPTAERPWVVVIEQRDVD